MQDSEVGRNGKRPRGRPRQYDPQAALAAAMDTFWTRGFAGTSLDDLASAMGMNRPSLYAAFGDKRSLYVKTLEAYRDQARLEARELLASSGSLRIFLTCFYDAALEVYFGGADGARGCYSVGTAATEAAVDVNVRAFLSESIRGSDAFLESVIRQAQERKELAAEADPITLARVAAATLHTLAVRSRAGHDRPELRELAKGTIDLICAD